MRPLRSNTQKGKWRTRKTVSSGLFRSFIDIDTETIVFQGSQFSKYVMTLAILCHAGDQTMCR
jgi:hypothetical protein